MDTLAKPKLKEILPVLRPKHWIKNIFIFIGPFFSANLFMPANTKKLLIGFIYWCGIASAVYVFNDIVDRQKDINHPLKNKLPIAANLLPAKTAWIIFMVISLLALGSVFAFNVYFGYLITLYFILNVLYSVGIKNIIILDITCVTIGFVLRVLSGMILIGQAASMWLFGFIFTVTLLLSLEKRRRDLLILKNVTGNYRFVLNEYSKRYWSYVTLIIAIFCVLCYIFYTRSSPGAEKAGALNLTYTVFFLMAGLFRIIYARFRNEFIPEPVDLIFRDKLIMASVFLWFISIGLIVYFPIK